MRCPTWVAWPVLGGNSQVFASGGTRVEKVRVLQIKANYLVDQLKHNHDLASFSLSVGLLKKRCLLDLFQSEVSWAQL